ncbi:PIG-L deacetylase family protein [Saccharopolyspora taberi]
MPRDWKRAMAVVAHPDDLEYGAAAAIAEWTDTGHEVCYLLATRGEAGIDTMEPEKAAVVREGEERASAAVVGVSTVEFLGHRDGVLEEGVALRRDITAAIRRHRPDLLITVNHHDTWGGTDWNTPDHRAVGRAALDAAGDAGNRWIFPEQLADAEPWNGVRWVAVSASPALTHVAEVGQRSVDRAIASLAQHRAYIAALTDQDPEDYARSIITEAIESLRESHGVERGVGFQLFAR